MKTYKIGKESAFTLIEILIVLVLLSIVITIVLPVFNNFVNSVANKSTPNKVLNILKNIRSRAIISGKKQGVCLKDNHLIYTDENGEKMYFSKGIKKITIKSSESNKIYFFPDGTCSGAILLCELEEGNSFKIKIDSVTAMPILERLK